MKLKKISENENVVLPPIKNSYDNPTLMESKKIYNNIESSSRMKNSDENVSRITSFNNTKGSGTKS